MGGQAFAKVRPDDPVKVPRMPTDLYQKISQDVKAKLEMLFHRVTIPREAPGKTDHGDIDFLVEGIRSSNEVDIWDTIKKSLDAKLHESRGDSQSFAITHPDIPDAYVQVDVELAPGNDTPDSAELFEWTRFMKGDSDLLQIIGVCHRPLGLVCNDRGLHIRVEEIEPYNKKKALLFLTRDPEEALKLYGLDSSRYRAGFRDEADMFEWISSGRFFAWEVFDNRVEKSNDRSRQNKRAMYRRFVEDYMPAHEGEGQENNWTRQQVLEEALATFGKHDQYNAMMAEHKSKEAEEALWKEIKDSLPMAGNSLTSTLKGLRRWVDFKAGQPFITATCVDQTPVWTQAISDSEASKKKVLDWVAQNWGIAKSLEKRRAKEAREAVQSIASV